MRNEFTSCAPILKRRFLAVALCVVGLQIPIGIYAQTSLPVPSPESLFLTGTFGYQKKPWQVFYENHYGQELDLSVRRPVVDLSNTIFSQVYGRPGYRLIGNFFHREEFFLVRIPDEGVKNVYFQLYFFPPSIFGYHWAGHALLRVEMHPESPIEIVGKMPTLEKLQELQDAAPPELPKLLPPESTDPDRFIKNVALTAEANWIKNDRSGRYSMVRGSQGAFIRIYRMVSMEYRFERFLESGAPVAQVKLDIEKSADKDAVLSTAIYQSQSDGLQRLYNTWSTNCITQAFDTLDCAISRENHPGIFGMAQRRLPRLALQKADALGADIVQMSFDPTLREEAQGALTNVMKRRGYLLPANLNKMYANRIMESIRELKLVVPVNSCDGFLKTSP